MLCILPRSGGWQSLSSVSSVLGREVVVYIAFPSWFMGLAPFHPSLAVWTSWLAQSLPTPFASISRMSGKLRVFWLQRHIKNDKSILILNTFIFSNLLVSFWMLSWVSALPCHHPQSWPLWPGDGEAGMRPCAQLLEVKTQDTSGLSAIPPGLGSRLPTRGQSSGDPATAPLEPTSHALEQIFTGPLYSDTVVCLGGGCVHAPCLFSFY